ncbi:protein-L-isoaspartate(D-aspartate) O-methyltransferase [Novosphingobium chloroacetimidivorans]|uniref:Protein-L-isoaspartate(D-aspartate) O-methyltransferase n=1 Tax=Novosphingobium chloroacetimidivorans TaxID=1428314 RepID=A0A7W7NVY8_9SPHN|nr:protein-L-isoaspartate O-methyltransferase [Novosphingobium chloroacetimidivorans]MBB4857839.1 protein-L-isoaspartate(D-aspartate) O-methyltransferase [Novosphingobium chloroacetimidivorans]
MTVTPMTVTEERSSEAARRAMIDSQLRTSGINEPWILDPMGSLPREDFVPATMREAAYIDRAIPLGDGRMLAAPLFHGRLLAEGRPTKSDKALLVGDAQGYFAALLRPLVGSLDVIAPAEANESGTGDYTLLAIDGAVEVVPERLADRLADDGRVVTGQVLRGVTRIATGRKSAGTITLLPLAEIGIPILPEFAAPKRWTF